MVGSIQARLSWYVLHRLEYLNHRLGELKQLLETTPPESVDFDVLREYFEVRGSVRELKHLLEHAESW